MTWKQLLAEGRLAPHRLSHEELEDLRAAVARDLADAALEGLSTDNRFGTAYEAALLLTRMAIADAGYRVKGQGAHWTQFVALPLAMGEEFREVATYFDHCRRKRNTLSYEAAGIATEPEAEELVQRVNGFRQDVENWISKQRP